MPRSTDDEERRPASRVTTTELLRGLGLAGDAVPVRVRCPAAADGPCRDHLRLASR